MSRSSSSGSRCWGSSQSSSTNDEAATRRDLAQYAPGGKDVGRGAQSSLGRGGDHQPQAHGPLFVRDDRRTDRPRRPRSGASADRNSAGLTFPPDYQISRQACHKAFKRAIAREPSLELEELRRLDNARCEEMLMNLQPAIRKGNPRAIEAGIKALDHPVTINGYGTSRKPTP